MAVNFSGEWISSYSYHNGKDASQHVVVLKGDTNLEGRSLPQTDSSELSLKLSYDHSTNTLTGSWREATSPAGSYRGKIFHGALQMVVNKTGNKAEGKWVGYSSDLTHINSGEWQLTKR